MERKSKTKRSTPETKPPPNMESVPKNSNTVSVPTNYYVDAIHFGDRSVQDFEIWLSTLMGGADWERQVDAFSDETC